MTMVEREKRMGLHLPVEVRGEDAGGVRFTEYTRSVNISGGGVSFTSPREFKDGDRLALKIILPPFTPIQTVIKIIRSSPNPQGQGFALATEFIDLNADDQERLIRHILRTQAERLRARRSQVG